MLDGAVRFRNLHDRDRHAADRDSLARASLPVAGSSLQSSCEDQQDDEKTLLMSSFHGNAHRRSTQHHPQPHRSKVSTRWSRRFRVKEMKDSGSSSCASFFSSAVGTTASSLFFLTTTTTLQLLFHDNPIIPSVHAVQHAEREKENFALCLGNFEQCHDYVETLLGEEAGSFLRKVCESFDCAEKNQDKVDQLPITQQDFDDGVWKLHQPGYNPESLFPKTKGRVLIPYLDYCAAAGDNDEENNVDKRTTRGNIKHENGDQLEQLLQDDRICHWGHEQDHVPLSLDQHVFGLSHFANGLQQVVDGGLPEEQVRSQANLIIDLCEQMREISVALLSAEEKMIDPSEFAIEDNAKLLEQYQKFLLPSNPENPHFEEVGDSLLAVYGRWKATVEKEVLGYRDPNALNDLGKACVVKDVVLSTSSSSSAVAASKKNNKARKKNGYETALALQLTVAARLLMLHARTSLGLKLVFTEVFQSQNHDFPWNLPPVYVFQPIAYGRHWDMLDAFLLEEWHSDLPTLLLDRDVRFLLRGHPQKLVDRRTRPLRVLEIGVAVGQNGNYLLSRFPNLHYTGVDPTIAPEVRARFAQNFAPHRYDLLAETSQATIDRFPDASFDLIFIDGPHTYKQVNHDILHYAQKVKPLGILAGHDFTCVHPPLLWGVSDQRLWQQKIYYGMDGVWWWRVGEEEETAQEGPQEGGEL
ncbi:unnamed protein product [Amoebophrya sp. A120]|nr:unnamed protein product [Amoebophrya sp. A120]|eukprot:GSA120T00000268001.1